MCKKFLKLNLDNDDADVLARNHPNAFLLLFFIARRARRTAGSADGLIIGDALIGSGDLEPGMSRQNFRTALNKLVEFGHVEIVANGKSFIKREKSTIKITIKGLLVNLVKSTIWDINYESPNQQSNQRLTNDQPTGNHKEEGRRISSSEDKEEEAQTATRLRSRDVLVFDFQSWEFQGITEKDMAEWKLMYPHIDLKIETLKASQWLKNNPSKSGKKNWRKYLTGWFGRSNDSIENKKAYKTAISGQGVDRRTKDIDGVPVDNQYKGRF